MDIVGKLKGTYPIRLYEYLKSKLSLVKYKISITELRDILQIPKDKTVRFSNLNNEVIRPSLRQIKDNTDIVASHKKANTGHKWTHVEFTIKPNKKKQTVKLEANPITEIKQPQRNPEEYEFIEPIAALAAYANKETGVDGNEIMEKV